MRVGHCLDVSILFGALEQHISVRQLKWSVKISYGTKPVNARGKSRIGR